MQRVAVLLAILAVACSSGSSTSESISQAFRTEDYAAKAKKECSTGWDAVAARGGDKVFVQSIFTRHCEREILAIYKACVKTSSSAAEVRSCASSQTDAVSLSVLEKARVD